MQEKDQNIETLLHSYSAISQQGEILGEETIRPLLSELESRILGLVPSELDEYQQKVLSAWETLRQTTEQLGLEMPLPSDEVLEVIEANNRYATVLSALGELGIVRPITIDEEIVLEPQSITTSTNLPSDKIETSEDDSKIETDKSTKEQEVVKKVVIVSGNITFTPKPQRAEMYLKILDKLAKSGSDGFSTTEFVRELTGGYSSRELQLMSTGEKELPAGIDLKEARRISAQFYAALGILKDKNMLAHESGSMPGTVNRSDSVNSANSGFVKPLSKISITEVDGVVNIDLTEKHYKVSIDQYRQEIDNGVGRKIQLEKDITRFDMLTKSLGAIASSNPEQQERFTRSDVATWLLERYGLEDLSRPEKEKISHDLSEVIEHFEGDFPLTSKGRQGGSYYVWQNGTELEVVEGFPEKPDFDNAVVVNVLKDGSMTLTIDGKEYELASVDSLLNVAHLHSEKTEQEMIDRYFSRARSVLELFSVLESKDIVSLDDILNNSFENINTEEKDVLKQWLRSFTKKINTLTDLELVNWRNLNGVHLDLNRRVVFNSNNAEESSQIETSPIEETEFLIEDIKLDGVSGEILEHDAFKSPSVKDALKSASELDDRTKSLIRGRLVERGRFEYPKQLGEAVYLLELIMDKETYAQLRESNRFVRQDYSSINQFISEVMLACYFRTLSWGKFDELVDSIARSPQTAISSHAASKSRELKSLTVDIIKKDITGNKNSAEITNYEEDALVALMDGWVREPKSPLQAVTLLDTFRKNRALIVDGKTPEQVKQLVSAMQDKAGEVLGASNLHSLISGRQQGRAKTNGRAVQTSTGEEIMLSRTDSNRFPDHRSRHSNRRKSKRR
jgi:hypothetical protein